MTRLKPEEQLLENVMFEQGYDEILMHNYQRFLGTLRHNCNITYDMIIDTVDNRETTLREAVGEDIYCFLVELYGEYGVTLRTGWITDKRPFVNFIKALLLDHNITE